jgi:hypothetical protein
VQSFSRPVSLSAETRDARFRKPASFGGRDFRAAWLRLKQTDLISG